MAGHATNLSNQLYALKELLRQDKYKKIKLKLKHRNARSDNIV